MGETPTVTIATVFEGAGTVITKVLEYLGTVATSLLGNPIFQVMIGIAVLYIVLGIVFKLVRKMRKGGK